MSNGQSLPKLAKPVSDRDHWQCNFDAIVRLVHYGNYECLNCREFHRHMRMITNYLGNGVCYVFRHFVDPTDHPQARRAAEVAEAAAMQDKFWQMHQYLMEHPLQLDPESLRRCACTLGLAVDQFFADLNSSLVRQRVQEDFEGAIASGVITTPSFFINEIRYINDLDPEMLLNYLEDVGYWEEERRGITE